MVVAEELRVFRGHAAVLLVAWTPATACPTGWSNGWRRYGPNTGADWPWVRHGKSRQVTNLHPLMRVGS